MPWKLWLLMRRPEKSWVEAAHQKVMEHYLTVNTGKDAMEELLCSESYTK